jgi:hypothetical protein
MQQVFICLSPSRTPYYPPPPTYTLYVCIQYTYSQREEGRVEPEERRLEGNCSQSWVEDTNMIDFTFSLETLINTCRKAPLQVQLFRGRHFVLVSTFNKSMLHPIRFLL